VALPERLETDNLLHGYGGAEVLEPAFLARVDPTAPAGALIQSWWLAEDCCQVNQLIALDLKYALADRQLPAAMRACEMAGVEAAFPFLGDAVVAFAARLSPHQKLDRVRLSPFLSEALRALLPHKAASAQSAAVPPFGHWLQSDRRLRGIAFDSLSDLKRRASPAGVPARRARCTGPSTGRATAARWPKPRPAAWSIRIHSRACVPGPPVRRRCRRRTPGDPVPTTGGSGRRYRI
jgi:hypothetical protein